MKGMLLVLALLVSGPAMAAEKAEKETSTEEVKRWEISGRRRKRGQAKATAGQ